MAAKKPVAAVEAELAHVEQLCVEHFPHGWRHVDPAHDAVACEHGGWARTEPATTPVDPPEPEQPPAD